MGKLSKTIFALIMLAVWLPCTVHCDLEKAAKIASCCPESTPQSTSDCGDCHVCDSVESGGILAAGFGKLLKDQPVFPLGEFQSFFASLAPPKKTEAPLYAPEPREVLSVSSQVFLRASHPIRAPSPA